MARSLRPRVKICGVTREPDLRAAVAAGADAVGLVVDVDVETPREISPTRAANLARAAPPFVTTVLVTMPDHAAESVDLLDRVRPDAVQVHGEMDAADLATLSAHVGSVIRAVGHDDADAFAPHADALIVDSGGAGAGGTGETHDWNRTRDLVERLDVPVVLAGGLTPGNVARAVERVRPFAVDVASGVEREGGVKDHDAVRAFVARATGGEVSRV